MCMTYRHDYGLVRLPYVEHLTDFPFITGMFDSERKALWNQMAQIFDNDIWPYMNFREQDDWK